ALMRWRGGGGSAAPYSRGPAASRGPATVKVDLLLGDLPLAKREHLPGLISSSTPLEVPRALTSFTSISRALDPTSRSEIGFTGREDALLLSDRDG
ncbi:MAG TPA: hypothetical protein VH391_03950, partial [Solirubrobacterales bacterium]